MGRNGFVVRAILVTVLTAVEVTVVVVNTSTLEPFESTKWVGAIVAVPRRVGGSEPGGIGISDSVGVVIVSLPCTVMPYTNVRTNASWSFIATHRPLRVCEYVRVCARVRGEGFVEGSSDGGEVRGGVRKPNLPTPNLIPKLVRTFTAVFVRV